MGDRIARSIATAEHGAIAKMKMNTTKKWVCSVLCGFGLLLSVTATGCQVSVGGQTLPSPYWLKDDVQYYPKASEFKLQEEANEMERYKAEQELLGNN